MSEGWAENSNRRPGERLTRTRFAPEVTDNLPSEHQGFASLNANDEVATVRAI